MARVQPAAPALDPSALPDDVFWPVRVDPAGREGPTRKSARGPRWRRSSRGLHVPSRVELTDRQRIVEAAATLPHGAAITGWASLRWRRARWFDGVGAGGHLRPVVRATSARDIRPQPGLAVCAERLAPVDIELVDGVPCTTAVRSAWFEMRHAQTLRDAVVVLDMAAYDDLVSIEEMTAFALQHPGWTGAPRCREALPLARENSWSPTETGLRHVCEVHGQVGRLVCNAAIFDPRGRHLATVDLLDAELGVVIEYEGDLHLVSSRRAADLGREALLRGHGLEYVAAVGADLARPDQWLPRLHQARDRASVLSGPRAWTLDPPPWWIPTDTVAARRALSASDRARLLGYRAA